METKYEVSVEIGGYRKDREKELIRACMVEWNFREDDFIHVPGNYGKKRLLHACALGTIMEDEVISDIVARIERCVWRVNGSICHVECRTVKFGNADEVSVLTPCDSEERMIA